ncbi:MAG: exopolyphosphatase / guanosine-5-triphosphate,3-diphosphate pyrophosphatase, partial [Cryptosporangiaceae bacterium]|nr:exopolyphosphatase / guanosine-5-triphosphate,3-diphosphate pyrophosphatase [Cryptosporangiaceae bacterium]
MRLGVLDVGSNTVHLLVVDAHRGGHPMPAYSEKSVLRLAEHVDDEGRLSDSGADALIQAVASARKESIRLEADDLLAFATSAIREASNGERLLARVRDETGVPLEVLSGADEARLTFLAVRRWFGWSAGRLLCLDIGGGS